MKNKVELIGWYGGDEAIACSGWTSTSRDLPPEKRARIGKFINDLWKAEPVPHGTPLEKGIVHFLVTTDIASHIHLLKHRLSSLNSESARYKELKEDKYYIPVDWIAGAEQEKSLSYWSQKLEDITKELNWYYHECIKDLTPILGRKRAKESARYFKMYNMQYEADVMYNMRSFNNLLVQRTDDHAQLEIREITKEMLRLVQNIEGQPFKHTLKAWGYGEDN